jgi:hypothetical protein
MKNIYQLLREKEQRIEQVRKEIEALRAVAPLLADQPDTAVEPILSDRPGPVKTWP